MISPGRLGFTFWLKNLKHFTVLNALNFLWKKSLELLSNVVEPIRGEFNSAEFIQFWKSNGIRRQLTTTYTQQNGVAERKNRTIMNLVRSMLAGKRMPKVFWPEAVGWAVYVLNRSPTTTLGEVIP